MGPGFDPAPRHRVRPSSQRSRTSPSARREVGGNGWVSSGQEPILTMACADDDPPKTSAPTRSRSAASPNGSVSTQQAKPRFAAVSSTELSASPPRNHDSGSSPGVPSTSRSARSHAPTSARTLAVSHSDPSPPAARSTPRGPPPVRRAVPNTPADRAHCDSTARPNAASRSPRPAPWRSWSARCAPDAPSPDGPGPRDRATAARSPNDRASRARCADDAAPHRN